MTDLKPSPEAAWAILIEDPAIPEDGRRLAGIYYDPGHANADAIHLQGQEAVWVEVAPIVIHRAPQWVDLDPALEQTDADFDVPVQQ